MMPVSNIGTRVPLQIRRGTDFACLLTFTNPDNTPLDLTGSTLAAGIWVNGENVANFTVVPSAPPTLGTAPMTLAAAVSLAIPPVADYLDDDSCPRWGLTLTDATGKVSSLLYGPLALEPAL